MTNSARASIVGLGFAGFRDIRARAHIGPWTRLGILGGVNNSGKSALLDIVERHLRSTGGGLQMPFAKPEGLDTPMSGEGERADDAYEYGVALSFEEDPITGTFGNAFARMFRGINSNEVLRPALAAALDSEPFLGSQSGTHRWFWFAPTDPPRLAQEQLDALNNTDHSDAILRAIISDVGGSADGWHGVIHNIVRYADFPRRVVKVPPARRIASTGHRSSILPGTDGNGLPGMLLSLIAPEANDYRDSKRRLAAINDFVRRVLDEPSAELLVPHNADTVHVAMHDKVLPLRNLGAGIEQVVLLAAICTEYDDAMILLEEPDLFLHPTLQRQLLHYLVDSTSNTYLAATHSAAMLDTDFASIFRVAWDAEIGTTVERVSAPLERARLATELGFRASDLVQANAVIWIEGPSDRIYLKQWISATDARIIEGIHYSFVVYGGRLGENLSFGGDQGGDDDLPERVVDAFIDMTRINRHAIFVVDSDLTETDAPLANYKDRLQREFENRSDGHFWVTSGVMIENYVEPDAFDRAYAAVHPRKAANYDGELSSNPFHGGVKRPDKVRIAVEVTAIQPNPTDRGGLRESLDAVCRLIARVNGMTTRIVEPAHTGVADARTTAARPAQFAGDAPET